METGAINSKRPNLFLNNSLEKGSETPSEAFWVAIADPLVSLLLWGSFNAINIATGASGVFSVILGVLASVNLALCLFNPLSARQNVASKDYEFFLT